MSGKINILESRFVTYRKLFEIVMKQKHRYRCWGSVVCPVAWSNQGTVSPPQRCFFGVALPIRAKLRGWVPPLATFFSVIRRVQRRFDFFFSEALHFLGLGRRCCQSRGLNCCGRPISRPYSATSLY